MKKYLVYILKCQDDSFYTGFTGNWDKRIKEHQTGKVPYTRNKKPLEVVYKEVFDFRKEAAKREQEIKGWRREKKKDLIKNQACAKNKLTVYAEERSDEAGVVQR